ncbi:conserved hypothetical protein, partial [Vibrio parahaemolyticus AQ3810]
LDRPVYNGGPISEDRGFILHKPKDYYESSIQMTDDLAVTTSRDILSVLGTEAEPSDYLVALGYSGWSAGQLENDFTHGHDAIRDLPSDSRCGPICILA